MKIAFLFLLLGGAPLVSAASPPTYFPLNKQTKLQVEGWSPHLQVMGEPSLYQRLAEPIEEYRFLYLPSFKHPISIRVTRSGQSLSMRAVMLSGKGYKPGHIFAERQRALSNKEWSRFQTLLSRASFWLRPIPDNPRERDGSLWVMEGTGSYRYRLLYIWTPTSNTRIRDLNAFVECGKYLLSLSGLQSDGPIY